MSTTVATVVESVVAWSSAPPGDLSLARAREQFEQQTAPIESESPDYESRIAHFFDWFVVDFAEGELPPAVSRFAAAHSQLPQEEREILAGLLRSQRSLYRVQRSEGRAQLEDLLGGARYELEPTPMSTKLKVGDIFDGRVLACGNGIRPAPGMVFHPADTHPPLEALLAVSEDGRPTGARLLNSLLRMRDRLHRFTRFRAEHLYTVDALHSAAFSATWATSRPPPPG